MNIGNNSTASLPTLNLTLAEPQEKQAGIDQATTTTQGQSSQDITDALRKNFVGSCSYSSSVDQRTTATTLNTPSQSPDDATQPNRATMISKLTSPVLSTKAQGLFDRLQKAQFSFWSSCTSKEEAETTTLYSPGIINSENTHGELLEFSKKEKKSLLPSSPLWKTSIKELFSKHETGFLNNYSVITTPKNSGQGICARDDKHSMNAWSSELFREENSYPLEQTESQEGKEGALLSSRESTSTESSNPKKRIYASLRCAAWIPTFSNSGSIITRQATRVRAMLPNWLNGKPPGEQRLIDNMTSALELQLEDTHSDVYKTLHSSDKNSPENSEKNPIQLSILANSLVSGCVMGGTDPEGYLQDMQLNLIQYANEREEPFELKAHVQGTNGQKEERSVWVKPNIMMLSSPVQLRDRQLMSQTSGLLGVRNHNSNIKTVKNLEILVKEHIDKQENELRNIENILQLGPLALGPEGRIKSEKQYVELALNMKANQELMTEISEMASNRKDLDKGMYGDNYGNPHAFNARVAVLAHRMGMTPINNCKTGKDRTEDSEVAQKLLVSEIDHNINQKTTQLLASRSQNQPLSSAQTVNNFTSKVGSALKQDSPLVPKRDFLSAENFQKEINTLDLTNEEKAKIHDDIKNYYPTKLSQENLYQQIRNQFPSPIPESLDKLLTRREQTAHRRIAFGLSQAGFTIQMLNNKTSLLWGNKQERYPHYLFGLSAQEIAAYTALMKPEGKVKA